MELRESRKGGDRVVQIAGRSQQAGRSAERGGGSRRGGGHRARGCHPVDGTLEGVLGSPSPPATPTSRHHIETTETSAHYVSANTGSGSSDPGGELGRSESGSSGPESWTTDAESGTPEISEPGSLEPESRPLGPEPDPEPGP